MVIKRAFYDQSCPKFDTVVCWNIANWYLRKKWKLKGNCNFQMHICPNLGLLLKVQKINVAGGFMKICLYGPNKYRYMYLWPKNQLTKLNGGSPRGKNVEFLEIQCFFLYLHYVLMSNFIKCQKKSPKIYFLVLFNIFINEDYNFPNF